MVPGTQQQFVKIEIPDGPEVNFSGYIINAEGSRQDLKFIKANTDFPVPTNLTDLTSLMGLVNRFTKKRRKTSAHIRSRLTDTESGK